jgi:hypothetical protein
VGSFFQFIGNVSLNSSIVGAAEHRQLETHPAANATDGGGHAANREQVQLFFWPQF